MTKKGTIEEMHAIAHQKGGKCLSSKYINAHTHLKWECGICGNIWNAKPGQIKSGNWCPKCAIKRRSNKTRGTIEEMQEIAQNRGGVCLSTEYINSTTYLQWQCGVCLNIWKAKPANIKQGSWCPECAKNQNRKRKKSKTRKLNSYSLLKLADFQEIARKHGGKCLSTHYISLDTEMRWECKEGHQWESKASNIRYGAWCPECSYKKRGKKKRNKLKDFQLLAEKRNGKCLSTQYIDAKTELQFFCNKHHYTWRATPDSVKRGSWCIHCGNESSAEKRKDSLSHMQELAEKKGGRCISTRYINDRTKMLWECSNGHQWYATPNNIKGGTWCPKCSNFTYIHQEITREYFRLIFNHEFPLYPPDSLDWLKNNEGYGMELDGYCEELNLAFEYHGIQHYKVVKHFQMTQEDLLVRQANDSLKRELCQKKGVQLIEIPYWIELSNIQDFILSECRKQQIYLKNLPYFDYRDFQIYSPLQDRLDEIESIANKHGGKLISDQYINNRTKLWWECANGHQWKASPSHIKNGRWCPKCAKVVRGLKKRDSLENMQKIANERGGKCLSSEYNLSHSKLKWECAKGHQWFATPSNIKKGTWCPICAGFTQKSYNLNRKKHNLKKMHQIAMKRGGRCLSAKYINTNSKLLWACAKGHQWEAIPSNILKGSWCPICANQNRALSQRKSIEDMQKLALDNNGKCLSSKYINNHTKLLWECSEGHSWKTTPKVIQMGCWCPSCVKKERKNQNQKKRRTHKTLDAFLR